MPQGQLRRGWQRHAVPESRYKQPRRFVPRWHGGPYEKFAHSWMHRNYWRVAATLTRDEAEQECALVYATCVDRYINHPEKGASWQYKRVSNAKWFMALYKSALYHRWIRLQWNDENHRHVIAPDPMPAWWEDDTLAELPEPALQPEGLLAVAIAELPEAMRTVIATLAESGDAVLGYLLGELRGGAVLAAGERERINEAIRRYCRTPDAGDVLAGLQNLILE